MGLFGGISKMSLSDLDNAVDRIANYYRQTRLYLSVCNSDDAYNYFVSEYKDDIGYMIEHQYCYKYKGNYLIATDMAELAEDNEELFKHFYGIAPGVLNYLRREVKPVMFINSIGPSGQSMSLQTYSLVKQFVDKFNHDYVVLSDCTAGVDQVTDTFEKQTGCAKIDINSNVYYRWGGTR